MSWAEWKLPVMVAVMAMAIDLLLWISLTLIGGGVLYATRLDGYSQEAFSMLLGIWDFLHGPVTVLLMPYLIEYMPSHGGGLSAILAEIAYVAACLVWVGILVSLITIGARFFWRKYRLGRFDRAS